MVGDQDIHLFFDEAGHHRRVVDRPGMDPKALFLEAGDVLVGEIPMLRMGALEAQVLMKK